MATIIIEKQGWRLFNVDTDAFLDDGEGNPLFFEEEIEAASYGIALAVEDSNLRLIGYDLYEEQEIENESNS